MGANNAQVNSPTVDEPAGVEWPRRRRSLASRALLALPRAVSALIVSAGGRGDAPLRWR